MYTAYRCMNCRLIELVNDKPCIDCGATQWEPYKAGYDPDGDDGKGVAPNVVKDTLTEGFNWSAGRKFATRTEKNKWCKENDMRQMSLSEMRRKNNTEHHVHRKAITYGGQTCHRSSTEKS